MDKKASLFNLEAESGLLTLIAREPSILHEDLYELVPLDFYNKHHRGIFQAITSIVDDHGVVDTAHVFDIVNRQEPPVPELTVREIFAASVPGGIHKEYFKLVRDMRVLRDIQNFGVRVSKWVREYGTESTVEGVIDKVERGALKIRRELETAAGFHDMADVMQDELDSLINSKPEDRIKKRIPTGFPELDGAITGMAGGEMIVVAARPSHGKTVFLLQLLLNCPFKSGIISLEMSKEDLVHRLGSNISGVSWRSMERGCVTNEESRDFMKAVSAAERGRIIIDDTPKLNIGQVKSRMRNMVKDGAKLIGLDYLQLMTMPSGPDRYDLKVAHISSEIKGTLKELNVPGIILCQMNRDIEHRDDKNPKMSDIRESGAIEQDADGIWAISRPYGIDETNFDIHCLKGRNTGVFKTANLWIQNELQRITSVQEVSQ